jgi:broad specificity phosphatase PhoE
MRSWGTPSWAARQAWSSARTASKRPRRWRAASRTARSAHPEQTVALVSHGDVIKATLAYCLGVPLDLFQRIEISPASLSIVRVEPYGPEVLLINGLVEERLLQP